MSIAEKLTTIAENQQKVFDAGYSRGYAEWETILMNSKCFQGFFWQNDKQELREKWKEEYTQNGVVFTDMFRMNSTMTTAPILNLSKGTQFNGMFYGCSKLVSIPKLTFQEDNYTWVQAFYNCKSLKEIGVEGEIYLSLDFKHSPLSVSTMKEIIKHLGNLFDWMLEYAEELIFPDDCWANLEVSGKPFDEGLTSDNSLSWKDYVVNELGWNV